MTKKDILKQILYGMDPFVGEGVTIPIFNLVQELILDCYKSKGLDLFNKYVKEYSIPINYDTTIKQYAIDGWDGKTRITPSELIEKLDKLKKSHVK
jgi:phosphoribosylformimino-5-aminoimidazole carboxamide ribonucleotide (ProFAR) isomerase